MGRSKETFGKKEVRKKKEKKRKEKAARKLARQENKRDGKSLDDMIAYVDEFGNIVDTPPDPTKKKKVNIENIQISTPKLDPSDRPDPIRKGKVAFFNEDKGYGFINDLETQERVFVHVNNTLEDIREGDKVTFEVEMGPKGPAAIQVKLS
jgi:cold shock CspA family protein